MTANTALAQRRAVKTVTDTLADCLFKHAFINEFTQTTVRESKYNYFTVHPKDSWAGWLLGTQ